MPPVPEHLDPGVLWVKTQTLLTYVCLYCILSMNYLKHFLPIHGLMVSILTSQLSRFHKHLQAVVIQICQMAQPLLQAAE